MEGLAGPLGACTYGVASGSNGLIGLMGQRSLGPGPFPLHNLSVPHRQSSLTRTPWSWHSSYGRGPLVIRCKMVPGALQKEWLGIV